MRRIIERNILIGFVGVIGLSLWWLTSEALPLRTLVIDAGHGGEQTGVSGCGSLNEKDLVLDLALRIKKVASAHGVDADIALTRHDDVAVSWGQRLAFVNQQRQAAFISLHVDLAPTNSASGVRLYTQQYNLLPKETTAQNLQTITVVQGKHLHHSELLAENLLKQIKQRLPQSEPKWTHGDYTTLTGIDAPAVMIGVGFFSNPEECRRLQDDGFRDQLATAIAEGVNDYEHQRE